MYIMFKETYKYLPKFDWLMALDLELKDYNADSRHKYALCWRREAKRELCGTTK